MIGNDIVDLNVAFVQSNWRRKRFLSKVFTEYEQQLIKSSANPDKTVWLLWSMKESAYKINVQQYQDVFFSPRKLQCKILSKTKGLVMIKDEMYLTESQINNDFICTIASLKKDVKKLNEAFELDDDSYAIQHKQSSVKLMVAVSKKWDLPLKDVRIKKNKIGIPKLFLNTKELPISFSITHHGSYGAYSIVC